MRRRNERSESLPCRQAVDRLAAMLPGCRPDMSLYVTTFLSGCVSHGLSAIKAFFIHRYSLNI